MRDWAFRSTVMRDWTLRFMTLLFAPHLLLGFLLEFVAAPRFVSPQALAEIGLPFRLFAAFYASLCGLLFSVLWILWADRRRERKLEIVRDVMES
jgi:hypothetical protein